MKMIEIFYPTVAMFFLTHMVLFSVAWSRKVAVKKKSITFEHFKTYVNGSPTDLMLQTHNNFKNLFETPIFFYVISVIIFVTATADATFILLCWVYVGLRVFHSLIHITSNFVPIRFLAFILSITTLHLLWIRWLFKVL